MSEEHITALLARLKDDVGLREKLMGATDVNAAVAIARESVLHVAKPSWLRYQVKQTLELNDEDLEAVGGGSCSLLAANVQLRDGAA